MFLPDNPPLECFECSEKENKFDDIRYWLNAVLDQLYGKEEFDDLRLEHYLQELGAYAGVKLPHEKLAVFCKKSSDPAQEAIEAWKEYNQKHLKSLVEGA